MDDHSQMSNMPTNVGEKLYQQSMLHKEEREKFLERQRELKVEQELENVTFQPNIYTNPKRRQNRDGVKTEDFLLWQGERAQEKRDRLRKDIEEQEKEKFKFKPKICEKSKKMAERQRQRLNGENLVDSRTTPDRFNELYFDHVFRKQRKEEAAKLIPDSECTFRPKLQSAAKVSENLGNPDESQLSLVTHKYTHDDVFERMQ